ncbi:MAG: DUF1570 domain-containing protein [Planctomycetota bacterium]
MRWTCCALTVLLSLAAPPTRAGEDSAAARPHAPRDPGAETPTFVEPLPGPNLELPAWLSAATKERYAQAIEGWKAAFGKRSGEEGRARVQAAIEGLEEVRELDATCALADYHLGIAYTVLGDYPRAQRRLREAIKRNSGFHEAMLALGDACRWAGDADEALTHYGRALKAAPQVQQARLMRASLLTRLQRFEEAREDTRAGLEVNAMHFGLMLLDRKLKLVLEGPDWPETFTCETKHYVVRTNVDQAFAERIAEHAELIRKLYTTLFPRSRSKRKGSIVVFKEKAEYHQSGGPQSAGGHFDPAFKQLFLYRYPEESDTLLVLYHEGFHQFLDGVLEQPAPQWLNEGLADYFGPSDYVEAPRPGMKIRPNPWRTKRVRKLVAKGEDVPFERLMTMTQAEMYAAASVSDHYAQAWAMVYFLCEADGRAYFDPLKRYFKALSRGKDAREAFDDSFAKVDLDALQARWRAFVTDELK